MTRLVAKLVLAMLLLPCTGAVVLLLMSFVLNQRNGPPELWELIGVWSVVYTFVALYWLLLWHDQVSWTRERRVYTGMAGGGALLVGVAMAAVIGQFAKEAAVGALIGGGFPPIVWALATVVIWKESPDERRQRLAAAGSDAVSCPVCGYNLTGLRETRCPECGTQYTVDQLLNAVQSERAAGLHD